MRYEIEKEKRRRGTILGIVGCVPITGEVWMVPDWLSWALDVGCIELGSNKGFLRWHALKVSADKVRVFEGADRCETGC